MRFTSLFLIVVLFGGTVVPSSGRLNAQTPPSTGAYLGIQFFDIDPDHAAQWKLPNDSGVAVKAVQESSPAAAAGVRTGDVLLTYNGETILGALQLIRLVHETPPGRHVRIGLWRSGQLKNVTVVLGDEAQNPIGSFTSFLPPGDHTMALRPTIIPFALLVWKSPMLGIECESVSQQLAHFFGVKSGLLIRSVQSGTTGDRAGLKAGDILLSIGGKPVFTPADLSSYQRTMGSEVHRIPVSIFRDHKQTELQLTPE